MRAILCLTIGLLMHATASLADDTTKEKPADKKMETQKSFLDFEMKSIDGSDVKLRKYEGQVLLVVNVASKCGLTKRNYEALEPLFQKYKDRGFQVLAFPANNFLRQEPGSNLEIKKFCEKYNVSFDLFAKVSVKGKDRCELYEFLTQHPNKEIAGEVKWNFQKYLVNRKGEVIAKFGPRTNPNDEKLTKAIEAALDEARPSKTAAEKAGE